MTEESDRKEGTDSIVDIIIEGIMKQSNGSVENAITLLRENLNRKLNSNDKDTQAYATWYYLALAKLRGDDKEE